jgi:hypothetical protein
MYTQDTRDAIFLRDILERLGAGGIEAFSHYTLIGVPNGRADYTNTPKTVTDRHGRTLINPLSGTVSKDWTLMLFYFGGRQRKVEDYGRRTVVPALA